MSRPRGVSPRSLTRWQWQDYGDYHQTRRNLRIHLVAVPAFQAGNLLVLIGAARWAPAMAVAGVVLSMVAFGVQGFGHKKELLVPKRFTGPLNFLGRMFMEQWVTFPRFVASGGWLRNWREAKAKA